MSNLLLSPKFSASLARDVYALTKMPTIKYALESLNRDYGNLFTFTEQNMLKGKTGGPASIKCRTAFGFCLVGQGGYQGHAFMIFRGTQYLADWLTNLNIGTSKSAYSQSVHDGFNRSFKSMQPQLKQFLSQVHEQGITTVHCIGHSLGGALATLCSEWICESMGIRPNLYTFGSPRVGLEGFTELCASKIGIKKIQRVYHKTDVVPCIPVWPYVHLPKTEDAFYLPSPGVIPGAEYHDMRKYVQSIGEKSWKGLSGLKPEGITTASIKAWLEDQSIAGMGMKAINMIGASLKWVVESCIKLVGGAIQSAVGAGATMMDYLAYILQKGWRIDKLSKWVVNLIRKILGFLGDTRQLAQELDQSFIRSVLQRLQIKMNAIAYSALNKALVDGRAL